jgi:hypothetical protein
MYALRFVRLLWTDCSSHLPPSPENPDVLPRDTLPLMVERGRKHSNDSRCVGAVSTHSASPSRFDLAWETCVRTAQRVSVVCKLGATSILPEVSSASALRCNRADCKSMLCSGSQQTAHLNARQVKILVSTTQDLGELHGGSSAPHFCRLLILAPWTTRGETEDARFAQATQSTSNAPINAGVRLG